MLLLCFFIVYIGNYSPIFWRGVVNEVGPGPTPVFLLSTDSSMLIDGLTLYLTDAPMRSPSSCMLYKA